MKRFSLAILALVVATGAQAASEKSRDEPRHVARG